MTKRPPMTRSGRVAVLLAVALFAFAAAPVRGASSVEISVRALVAGRYEVGGWLALSVSLVNDGEPTDGFVSASTANGSVRRHVEMPAGARKVVSLYVQPDAFQRTVEVSYTDPNGTVRAEAQIAVLQQSSSQYAIAGDSTGTLRPQLIGVAAELPEPILIAPADVPERPEPLAGVASIVWAGDSSALDEAQRRTIERWVADGGQLIVLGGPDWQARTAGLAALLPVEDLAAVDDVPQTALAAWAGVDAPPIEAATVSTGTLGADARALVTTDDGILLAAMRTSGAGQVVFIGTDLATPEYRAWPGATSLWGRVLPVTSYDAFFGRIPLEEAESAIGNALNSLPSLEVPPAELLLALVAGYILLIGPVSYVVLRRVDRRELAWVTAPLLVVLFSASSFGIGRALKGSDVIVNQVSVVRSTSSGTAATVETYAGIFSPDRSTYDLTAAGDALMGRLANNLGGFPASDASDVEIEQGDPAHVRNLAIGVFGLEAVRAVALVDHAPVLSVTWRTEDGEVIGTVTNGGETAVTDVAWISSGGGEMIGDLAAGASADFTIPTTNFNGSAASDQVYGFGGLNGTSEEQRRVELRRQVINGLVGYGGFAPGFAGGSGSRGPFIIGWSTDEGPMPITVDGQEPQRYTTLVEVISARPSLGTGRVTIQPLQMAVNVLATEGDASAAGPATLMIADGSATFSVALPLEASGLEPTAVAVIVAPDPSAMANDTSGLGIFWPDGYTVEVRDPRTGEWVTLGELATGGRFEIDDPASAIDEMGRIEVRVNGTLDRNFGAATVFVSAQVEGVIGE